MDGRRYIPSEFIIDLFDFLNDNSDKLNGMPLLNVRWFLESTKKRYAFYNFLHQRGIFVMVQDGTGAKVLTMAEVPTMQVMNYGNIVTTLKMIVDMITAMEFAKIEIKKIKWSRKYKDLSYLGYYSGTVYFKKLQAWLQSRTHDEVRFMSGANRILMGTWLQADIEEELQPREFADALQRAVNKMREASPTGKRGAEETLLSDLTKITKANEETDEETLRSVLEPTPEIIAEQMQIEETISKISNDIIELERRHNCKSIVYYKLIIYFSRRND